RLWRGLCESKINIRISYTNFASGESRKKTCKRTQTYMYLVSFFRSAFWSREGASKESRRTSAGFFGATFSTLIVSFSLLAAGLALGFCFAATHRGQNHLPEGTAEGGR